MGDTPKNVYILQFEGQDLPFFYDQLMKDRGSNYQIKVFSDHQEFEADLNQEGSGVVLFSISSKEHLQIVVNSLKKFKLDITKNYLKFAGVTISKNPKVTQLLKKNKVAEILDGNTNLRSLKYKVDLWFKGITGAMLKASVTGATRKKVNLQQMSDKPQNSPTADKTGKVNLKAQQEWENMIDNQETMEKFLNEKLREDQQVSAPEATKPSIPFDHMGKKPKEEKNPANSTTSFEASDILEAPQDVIVQGEIINFAPLELLCQAKIKGKAPVSIDFTDLVGKYIEFHCDSLPEEYDTGHSMDITIDFNFQGEAYHYDIMGTIKTRIESFNDRVIFSLEITRSKPNDLRPISKAFREKQKNITKFVNINKQ